MATVYLARDLKHDRSVALKVLHPELSAVLGPERFQREIKLAARLQHPHILTVLDSGEAAGQLWFTMPFVEGESLRDRLRRERQLPVEDALRIGREAAEGLQYAHDHGVIHRDIKPENLLLTRDGNTMVADFGIARAIGGGDQQLTETGLAIGTPAYMSPEQAAGERTLDARTDIYSLGAVIYEMLAGEPPFTGPTAQAVIAKRLTEPAPRVRALRPSVTAGVDEAVHKALASVAADRFSAMTQLVQALSASTTATRPSGSVPRTPTPPRRQRSIPVAATTLVLGILIGLGVLFAWRRSHDGTGGPEPKALAVLPFENLGDSADAYFADGLADAVRGKLTAVPALAVIARASSEPYRESSKSPQEIGRELGVRYLLTATVRWAKRPDGTSQVQVSPELIEVIPGAAPRSRWQQPFEAPLTDVFQMQADIAGQVANALDVALGSPQQKALAQRPTANLAGYDAFLKGEAAAQDLGSVEPASLRLAIGFYEQAVALDSAFVEAWAQLARAHAALYFNGTPTLAGAEASRRAAERAVALAPDRPEGRLALGDYYLKVRTDNAGAGAAYAAGLAGAPENAELLVGTALTEQNLGRWEAALGHLERAVAVDPRSVTAARRLARAQLWLRHYPAARAAYASAQALAPASLLLLEEQAMIPLAQGDLAGARAVLRAAPAEVAPTALVAYLGNFWDLFWVLDDAQQQLLLRLRPSAFDDDRSAWGFVLAQTWHLRGDAERARAYADSARVSLEEQLAATPGDPQRTVIRGLVLAYLGRKAEAIQEGERGVALLPVSRDALQGPYLQHQLVRIYILAGEPERALDQLEPLLKMPYYLSPGWLKIDPTFAPLRGNPRFERLVAGK
jgi:serine/threonine-protein kinase